MNQMQMFFWNSLAVSMMQQMLPIWSLVPAIMGARACDEDMCHRLTGLMTNLLMASPFQEVLLEESLQMVIAAMKLKDAYSLEGKL